MTDNENFDLASYMEINIEGLSVLRDSLRNSFASLLEPQFISESLNVLSDSFNHLGQTISESFVQAFDLDIIRNSVEKLSKHFSDIAFSSFDFSSLANNLTITDNSVTLTDDTVEMLADFFCENNEASAPVIASKMSIKDFLSCILIPLLCMLIPMLQNSYYDKLDAIEAQQNQMQEAEYQEAILNLEAQHAQELEELNSNINELLQYLESVQDTHSLDANDSTLPDDFQESTPKSLAVENAGSDESGSQDMSQPLN